MLRALAFGLSLVAATNIVVAPASASMQSEMDSMFGSMSNATPPGAWNTARRGVLAGGSMVTRNKIMNQNLVSFAPPSFKGGCGGIDLFGGSFSFINSDQMIQLMRSVASNAAGYAFQIALDSMCPTCMQTIETLQKKIQALNSQFANSCQLAQGLVNDTLGAANIKNSSKASQISLVKGAGDVFESFFAKDNKTPEQSADTVAPNDASKRLKGNIVWRQLKKHSVSSWFGSGDDELLEVMMNVAGTVVVGDDQAAGDGGNSKPVTPYPGGQVHLKDLIDGGTVTIMGCTDGNSEDQCKQLGTKNVTISRGFKTMVLNTLLGTDSSPGIIYKISHNSGALSSSEKAFMEMMSGGAGGMIVRLAMNSETAAEQFARDFASRIALEMAYVVVRDLMRAVETSAVATDDAYANQLMRILGDSRTFLINDHDGMRAQLGPDSNMITNYNNLLNAVEHVRMAPRHSNAVK